MRLARKAIAIAIRPTSDAASQDAATAECHHYFGYSPLGTRTKRFAGVHVEEVEAFRIPV